jgi:N-acetylmuramoyl-L-alanine amidase
MISMKNHRNRLLSVIAAVQVGLIISFGTAAAHTNDESSDYLRIFTPQHAVKGVFSQQDGTVQTESRIKRQFTEDEIKLIASVVHEESRGEPFEGKVGVASVIINRLNHPSFPKSVEAVIFQKNAFSCVKQGAIKSKPDSEAYKAVDEALNGSDPTMEAIYFYNPKIASSRWIKNSIKVMPITIGNHVFFR